MTLTTEKEYIGECKDCDRTVKLVRDVPRYSGVEPALWAKCCKCETLTVVHRQ